ncbi:MAG: hypothetical protein LW714_05560 [Oxalobacteraceae bacterium]|nr:hypothetical protein [Oxalobacteraceae bacterium]
MNTVNDKKQMSKAFWNDLDVIPELDDEFFERADEYRGERLIEHPVD